MTREINIITAYCTDARFLHWPLASVYHQLRRDKAAVFNISTFYKYVSLLQLKRLAAGKRRKNHHTGIRAKAPLQILHADTTIFQTADLAKNYIYLIQDNFSRAILTHQISTGCRARFVFGNLQSVHGRFLKHSSLDRCQIITDDGTENKGILTDGGGYSAPAVQHLIAQRDIECSNSMIEAANKQLKYRFLYHQYIPDHAALVKYVEQAVHDFNNRPHNSLNGLTPIEVLQGKVFDQPAAQQQIAAAQSIRIKENKKTACCYYTF